MSQAGRAGFEARECKATWIGITRHTWLCAGAGLHDGTTQAAAFPATCSAAAAF